MKMKYIVSVLFLSLCSIATQAQSQNVPTKPDGVQEKKEQKIKFTGGPLLETNLSNFIHSGIKDGISNMKFGVSAGGFLNLGISKPFSVQGEMIFHYKTSDFSWDNSIGNYQYCGVEIPIYAMYHYVFSKGDRIHIGIGPYTEFGFGASLKRNGVKADLYEKNGETKLSALSESNSGFGIKMGYEFIAGLQINATYKLSVTNFLDANSSTAKILPQAISLGVAYRFGK